MILWDRGTWHPIGDPVAGYQAGKLKFTLEGKKLDGAWMLLRMRGPRSDDGKNWLLVKERDEHAVLKTEFEITATQPESINSRGKRPPKKAAAKVLAPGKAALTKSRSRTTKNTPPPRNTPPLGSGKATSNRLKVEDSLPGSPQLATLVSEAPSGEDWIHELKFDGYRFLGVKDGRKIKLLTRNGLDWSHKADWLAKAIGELPVKSVIIDGEMCALNGDGVTDFQVLQNSFKTRQADAMRFFAFDLLFCDGLDLRDEALVDRKAVLKEVLSRTSMDRIIYSDHIQGDGEAFFNATCKRGLEGIISKRSSAPYTAGRSALWVKVKCDLRQEFVIGGFTEPQGGRAGFGALALGYFVGKKLVYCGRVGTGFDEETLKSLTKDLKKAEQKTCSFDVCPKGNELRGLRWTKPTLLCEVRFAGWTKDKRLRQAAFMGLRLDKPAKDVILEQPLEAPVDHGTSDQEDSAQTQTKFEAGETYRGIILTNSDRILYADQGVNITKRELAVYYDSIADDILPHIKDRPLAFFRCPKGSQKPCFFQKHFRDALPAELSSVSIVETTSSGDYAVVKNASGLLRLAQLGILEIHPWGSTVSHLEKPDRLVFDLDPGTGVSMAKLVEGAQRVRKYLQDFRLESFIKTTGGKGLHVVVPIVAELNWEEAKTFTKLVSEMMSRDFPEDYLAKSTKALREGRIFIDYLRNGRGATSVAAFSTRARANATVSMPLAWDEVTPKLDLKKFTIKTVPTFLKKRRQDPWAEFFSIKQKINPKIKRLLAESGGD